MQDCRLLFVVFLCLRGVFRKLVACWMVACSCLLMWLVGMCALVEWVLQFKFSLNWLLGVS